MCSIGPPILSAMARYGMYLGATGGAACGAQAESGATHTSLWYEDRLVSFSGTVGALESKRPVCLNLSDGVGWSRRLGSGSLLNAPYRSRAMVTRGAILADFQVVGILDDGAGAGSVYEATRGSTGRRVALKLFRSDLSDSPDFRKRFREQVTETADLLHPHVVPIYEGGRIEQGLYLAMHLVRGRNLDELWAADRLEPRHALTILSSIASALEAAHAHGVLHRDLKPRKILIEAESDRAFLTGFAVPLPLKSRANPSQPGATSYMSPERLRGEALTARSDVYSLAVVLWQALAGRPPFEGSDAAKIQAHLFEALPRMTEYRPELPRELDDVLQRALATDSAERQRSASVLLAEVQRAFSMPQGARSPEADAVPARPATRGTARQPIGDRPRSEPTPAADGLRGAPTEARRPDATGIGRVSQPVPGPKKEAATRPSAREEDDQHSPGAAAAGATFSWDRQWPPPSGTGTRQRVLTLLAAALFIAGSGVAGWYAAGSWGAGEVGITSASRPTASSPETRMARPPPPASPSPQRSPEDDDGRALGVTMKRLNSRRATFESRVRNAATARRQARAARYLGAAFAEAAARLERTSDSANPPAMSALVASLERTAEAYDGLALAADRGDASGFRSKAREARRQEVAVRKELARLSRPGSLPVKPS